MAGGARAAAVELLGEILEACIARAEAGDYSCGLLALACADGQARLAGPPPPPT